VRKKIKLEYITQTLLQAAKPVCYPKLKHEVLLSYLIITQNI